MCKKILFSLFICLMYASAHSQILIPYKGGNDRYGYATTDGRVVVKPVHQGVFETMPANRFYTVLRKEGVLQALTRRGELVPLENGHDVLSEVENTYAYAQKIDTLPHLVAIKKGQQLILYNTLTRAQTEWLNPTRNHNYEWLQVRYSSRREEKDPLQFKEGVLPVWTSATTLNFIDTNMRLLFKRDFGAGIVADSAHFIVAEGRERLAIADRQGRVRTPFVWGFLQPGGKPGYFIGMGPVYTNNKGGHRYGLLDANGKLVLDTIYRDIQPFGSMLIVEKDKQFGIMDYQGREILPITAQQIYLAAGNRLAVVMDKDPQQQTPRCWLIDQNAKRPLADYPSRILAYDRRDVPHFVLEYPDRHVLCDTALKVIATLDAVGESQLTETNPWVLQRSFQEGAIRRYGLFNLQGAPLHSGLFDEITRIYPGVYRVKSGPRFGVINAKGTPLVPLDFLTIRGSQGIFDTLFSCLRADSVWVYYNVRGIRQPAPADPMPPPVLPEGFTATRPAYETGLFVVKDGQQACGVVNRSGEWVLPVQKAVVFYPLSPFLILEIPAALAPETWRRYPFPSPLKVHRVNLPQQQDPLKVDYIQYRSFEKKADNTKVDKQHPKLPKNKLIAAYIDEKGQFLTPFQVLNGPDFLKSRNLITWMDMDRPSATVRQSIVDRRGKTLFEMDSFYCEKMPHLDLSDGEEWTYLVVQKPPIQPETLLKHYEMRVPCGLLDTNWRLQLPIRYFNLKVLAANRLFAATDSFHTGLLYDWQGQLLHRFAQRPNQLYSRNNPLYSTATANHFVIVTDGHTTVLLNEQNQILRTYEAGFESMEYTDKRFFKIKDRDGRLIWVSVLDGKEFRQ